MQLQIRDIAPGDFAVDWGDGTSVMNGTYTEGTTSEWGHLYAANGNYTVTVTDAATAAHTAAVKVPAVKAIISTVNPPACYADDPPTTVNVTGTFDGTQKAYVDGIEVPTTSAGGTGYSFQVTPGTFPLEEGSHMHYAVQADGTRSNGKPFTVFAASGRRSAKKRKQGREES